MAIATTSAARRLLPTPGIAEDPRHPSAPTPCRVEQAAEALEVAAPSDERDVRARGVGRFRGRWRVLRRARRPGGDWSRSGGDGRRLPQQLAVERLRVRLRLAAQLALQRRHARLVLAQGGAAPPRLRVEPHESAVDGLLQRIDGDQLERGLDGGLRRRRPLRGQELRQPLHGPLAQPLPLADEPFLEWRLVERDPGEELATVEVAGPLEGGRRAGRHRALELERVHRDRLGIERYAGLVSAQAAVSEGLANRVERLAQAGARLLGGPIAPEQGGQLVARVGLAGRAGEVGQQRLALAHGEPERPPRGGARLEPAQDGDPDPVHPASRAHLSTPPPPPRGRGPRLTDSRPRAAN
jgi:hypothetical protein